LRHSLLAGKVRRRLDVGVVLSDIRHDLDLLPFSDELPLHLLNLDRAGGFARFASQTLRLTRYGRPVIMSATSSLPDLLERLDDLPVTSRVLVVGIGLDDLAEFGVRAGRHRNWLIGIHPDEIWALGGTGSEELPREWARPKAVPLSLGGRGQEVSLSEDWSGSRR